ncbi:hypothetical protein HJG52_17635 [Knoellia sp. DB2414S]|uniref:Uncharacterized protein n=2 Tax=Knoellia koreensis TaxID=2730921 RepID=A0A849HMC6_9MICO|nr:hypothetical protein [Knoellia sp. DB2414S]
MDRSGHEVMDRSGHQAMSHGSDEGMDHTSHEGMDHSGHGGMEMAPHGIPLAGRGEDRDGLEMDVLHLALGPVLRYWPAGLVLTVALQGDLVVDATVELLEQTRGCDDGDDDLSAATAARLVDHAADVLALSGWADGASRAARVRDLLLDGRSEEAELALRRLHRRVARSWLLRWSLRGAGRLDRQVLDRHDLPAWLEGDAYDRLLAILDGTLLESLQDRDGHGAAQPAGAATAMVRALPRLVSGLDLAEVRLLVASLALDTAAVPAEARHG